MDNWPYPELLYRYQPPLLQNACAGGDLLHLYHTRHYTILYWLITSGYLCTERITCSTGKNRRSYYNQKAGGILFARNWFCCQLLIGFCTSRALLLFISCFAHKVYRSILFILR